MLSWFRGKAAVKSPELKEAESVFTDAELKELQKLFHEELAHQAGPAAGRAAPTRDGALDLHLFGALLGPAWFCLDPLIACQLQRQLADRADGKVHLSGLVIAKARAGRLGEQASLEFTYGLLDVDGKGVGYRALEAAVLSCLHLTGAVPGAAAEARDPRVGIGSPAPGRPPGAGAGSGRAATANPDRESTEGGDQDGKGGSAVNADGDGDGIGASNRAARGSGGGGGGSGSGNRGDSSGVGLASSVQLQVAAICRGALACAAGGAAPAGGQTTAAAAAGAAAADEDVRLSYSEYCQWTKRCPALHKTLCGLMQRIGNTTAAAASAATAADAAAGVQHGGGGGRGGGGDRAGPPVAAAPPPPSKALGSDPIHLPELYQLRKRLPVGPGPTLLQPAWTWALASRLPPAQRVEWRLLFSSHRDGKSFNTFFARVSATPGPTLLLIRDKAGALFGGYASQPWAKSGAYFGDVSCFIFSLLPVMQVFPATGINDNFQWCGVGFSQLPGGLGFGGAAAESARGHFALYVEPSLDAGMSRPIATYGNTPLASEQLFQIDTLECWLLQPPDEEQQQPGGGEPSTGGGGGRGGGGGSVLFKAAEDRAIMEMAGLQMHSHGMVDEPLEEE